MVEAEFINGVSERNVRTDDLGALNKIETSVCLSGLSKMATEKVHDYLEFVRVNEKIDRDKLNETRSFFTNQETLQKLMFIYGDLLSDEGYVTSEKQDLLKGHLSFVLERAMDQHLNNPENYVSHGFNHTLNTIKYGDQLMVAYPDIIKRVHWLYDVTEPQSRFLLRNVALFHDFGYPISESKNLNKTTHSVVGADVISCGQTEVGGQKKSIREVLSKILDDSSNGRIVNDLRNSILLHNADKIDQFYDGKIITNNGGEFLVNKENISEALSALKKMGYKIGNISIHVDDVDKSRDIRLQVLKNLINSMDVMDIPTVDVKAGEKYLGRNFGTKGKKKILGLEYSDAVLMDEPLKTFIRIIDNTDIVGDERLSDTQKKLLFKVVCRELGDKNSHFYDDNKDIEFTFEGVKIDGDIDNLKRKIVAHILAEEIYEMERDLVENGTSEDMAKRVAKVKGSESLIFWSDSLQKLNINECMVFWRSYILDKVALRPEVSCLVNDMDKAEVRKAVVKLDSYQFRHFGGYEPIKKVAITTDRIDVEVEGSVYDDLNKMVVDEEIKSTNGYTSIVRIRVGEYQIRRLMEALRSIKINRGDAELPVYVNGKKYVID